MASGSGFLRPTDDEFAPSWTADRIDTDPTKDTFVVYNPRRNWSILAQRNQLPISKHRTHILYLLEKHQVLVVVGETGCGKSTQIPQFLMEAGWCKNPGIMVGITEPRRVAVTTLASRVAEECDAGQLGRKVGYSIRFDECFDRKVTKIKYMTEGILVNEIMADPLLSGYSVIMLDEVHERTAQIDIIMGLLKKILRKREDLRVIIASATVDAEYIQDYFNTDHSAASKTGEPPKAAMATVLSVEGTGYSVDVFYLKDPSPDYVKASAETVMKIHESEPPGDVLVFLTGMEEVDQCLSLLKEYERGCSSSDGTKSGLRLWPLAMHGSLPPRDQLKAFQPAARGHRKVVVATNIAETSITIEGIAYVVDSCFVKLRWFDPATFVDSLIVTTVSKASAHQRAGRAGRTRPGQCYRLCRESDFEALPLNTPPEMQRTDLSMAVLQLKALGIHNLVRFEFPSAPPSKNLMASLELLFALGALDEQGELSKPLGDHMSELPVHPMLSKMLLSSGSFGCTDEIAAIVAIMQVDSVFIVPGAAAAARARAAHREFQVEEGDLLTMLNVFRAFLAQRGSGPGAPDQACRSWCSTKFLKFKVLTRAEQLYIRLTKTMRRLGVTSASTSEEEKTILRLHPGDSVRRCIVSGMFPNAAYLHPSGYYRTVRGDFTLHVHPSSVLYTEKPASWVVFSELVHTNKVYMKDITTIDPVWLETLAPHYYEKKSVMSSTL